METRVGEDELKLLAYLHENAHGYGETFYLDAGEVAAAVGLDGPALLKAATYLGGWGLVGVTLEPATLGTEGHPDLMAIHFTAHGEAYMREVEHQLQGVGALERGRRLGLATVAAAADAVLKAAVGVLTELAKRHV